MGTAPVIGVAAVAATVGILFLILFDSVRELWLTSPALFELSLVCFLVLVSIVIIAAAS